MTKINKAALESVSVVFCSEQPFRYKHVHPPLLSEKKKNFNMTKLKLALMKALFSSNNRFHLGGKKST